jgi:hypothetical protein
MSDRIYARHAAAADRGAWSVERDVAWEQIDVAAARTRPDILDQLRLAALIEAFHPVNLPRLFRRAWHDVDAGAVLSLEAYEGFKHFHALRLYLDRVGHLPAITDDEIVASRRAAAESDPAADDLLELLVEFMLSEHLAYVFFRRHAEQAPEPVLAALLHRIAADEVRHAQAAADLLAKRIAADPDVVPRVLDAAASFEHFGNAAVGAVPVALPGDSLALRTFARRIERLCGVRLVDHLKRTLMLEEVP